MSGEKKPKAAKTGPNRTAPVLGVLPEPVTLADRVVIEIRKFIAAAIFFNSRAAEKAGLGLTDMQMLHTLQLYGPSTPGRLAAWTGLSSGGVTVALDRLEKAGFIHRAPNPDDRRSLLVTLAPVRLGKLSRMYADVERETRRLLATLPESDLEAVVRFFTVLGEAQDGSDLHKQS
ncbi:MAG: MarR family winged helix-turn-helix transcriptional regulator [Terracidiphilus sp.]|jgi:DNA-binding MarR family transcriptional regulator